MNWKLTVFLRTDEVQKIYNDHFPLEALSEIDGPPQWETQTFEFEPETFKSFEMTLQVVKNDKNNFEIKFKE